MPLWCRAGHTQIEETTSLAATQESVPGAPGWTTDRRFVATISCIYLLTMLELAERRAVDHCAQTIPLEAQPVTSMADAARSCSPSYRTRVFDASL